MYPLLSKRPLSIYLSVWGWLFFIYVNQSNKFQLIQCRKSVRIQQSTIKPNMKKICKNIKQCHSSPYFLFWKLYFSKNMLILLTYYGFIIVILLFKKEIDLQKFSEKIWRLSIAITYINRISLVFLTFFKNVKVSWDQKAHELQLELEVHKVAFRGLNMSHRCVLFGPQRFVFLIWTAC